MKRLSKSEIALFKSLSLKRFRDKESLFVVEGEKMVEEVSKSDFTIISKYSIDDIGEEQMSKISHLSSPSPIIAIVKMPKIDYPDFHQKGLSIALDSVRDPGNMGTIIRLADWFGIESIFASEDCVDMFNSKVVQASMGAVFRKKVYYLPIKNIVQSYVSDSKSVYGTFLDGENIYTKDNLDNDALIVMGSENNGISEDISRLIPMEKRLFIPPFLPNDNQCESLNVAIATAITCAEFRRRIL